MRTMRLSLLFAVGALAAVLAPPAEAACRVCQENQGMWLCVYTSTRIRCLVDGDNCTMTLVSACVSTPGGGRCVGDVLAQHGLLQGLGDIQSGTVWLPIRSSDDPLVLTQISFGLGRTIKGGQVLNKSHGSIAAYQLGLITVERGSSDSKVVPGPLTQVTVPIKPEEIRGMLKQPLEGPSLDKDLSVVAVFFMQVRFSDGSSWQANTTRLQADVERLTRSSAKKHSTLKRKA